VTAVQWDGPAFDVGVTVGTQVVAVNGESFGSETLRRAVTAAKSGAAPIELLLKTGDRYRTVAIDYRDGLRYPHLERDRSRADLLTAILTPRTR
jgi:predicted metalloprotease with PDZ domain